MTNRIINRYIHRTKVLFPSIRRCERQYLSTLKINIMDYAEEHPDITYDELCSEFGSPADVLTSYLAGIDMDEIIKRINITRIVRIIATIIAIAVIAVAAIRIIHMQQAHAIFEREEVVLKEFEIN